MQFTTLITLTVATSMAVLSAMAAPARVCPTVCPAIYQPVCAKLSSGEFLTFGNACQLDAYKCDNPTTQITVVSNKACESITIEKRDAAVCGTICPAVYQPICARAIDGLNKVFGNACELRNYNCKHPNANFAAVADANCEDLVVVEKREVPVADDTCNTICPTVYQPVCAKAKTGLNMSFGNACELKNYNCKHPNANFAVVANSNCKDIPAAPAPTCDFMCTMDEKPVCGKSKDGKTSTFSNSCILALHNCQNPTAQFESIANTACPTTTVCKKACTKIYKPVCAKLQSGEFKTFGNVCEMNVFNCEHPNEKARLIANAECPAVAPAATTPKKRAAAALVACPTMCPMVFKPVCAKNVNGDLQTFGNKCQMGVFNCKNPTVSFTVVAEGACEAM